ncbi:MAG: TIGR00703 family protein [Gammaproteobacteria bacterium]|nr:MAG: TIGR00703 family protein [Gammaproteobacteria bacterium]
MGKRARAFEVKYASVLGTLVYELEGEIHESLRFTYRDLKRWGYDLVKGTRDGRPAHFLVEEEERHKAGDAYEEAGESFAIDQVLDALPEESRLLGRIEMIDGTAWLALALDGGEGEQELWRVPAAELLLYYLSREGLHELLAALDNVGTRTGLIRSRGQIGKALPHHALPRSFVNFLREARKLGREIGDSRITLACFGENKEGRQRYKLGWTLSTLALFDRNRAEKIDRLLGALG